MKKLFLLLIMFIVRINLQAQNDGFNYKAQITENGAVLANHSVDVRISISCLAGDLIYQEEHSTTTDENGIIILHIGKGTPIKGTFESIDWQEYKDFWFLGVDINTGNGYRSFGVNPINYVPLAKYADKAGNVFSGDFNDLTNVPGGLSDGDDDTHLTEAEVDNYVSNNGYLTSEVDGDTTNELQNLSYDANTGKLSISSGDTVYINTPKNKELDLSGVNLTASGKDNQYLIKMPVEFAYFSSGADPGADMYLPINIPVGAHLDSISVSYVDNSDYEDFHIYAADFFDGAFHGHSVNTSGNESLVKTTTFHFDKSITTNEYIVLMINVIEVDGNQYWPDDKFKFCGAKVFYKE
jgi:hypothetical protein